MKTKQILQWIKEITIEPPNKFSSYFIQDIYRYINIESINGNNLEEHLKGVLKSRYNSLKKCKTKEEVRLWLHKITSFVVMKIDIDNVIEDYFSQQNSLQ